MLRSQSIGHGKFPTKIKMYNLHLLKLPILSCFSEILPDAIQTGCDKCTDEQKAGAKKVASYLIKEKPEWWNELLGKYDPDNTYRTKFSDRIKAEGLDF